MVKTMEIHNKFSLIKFVLFFLCLYLFNFTASASYFKHLGMSDGLSHLSVRSLYQDRLGRIWIGTQEGISVYDGKKVFGYKSIREGVIGSVVDKNQNKLLGNLVSCITGDNHGDVFLLVDDNLVKYDLRKESLTLLGKGGFHFIDSFEGVIWGLRHDSIFKYDSKKGILFTQYKKLKRSRNFLIEGNVCWVGTANGLYKIDIHRGKEQVIKNADISTLFKDKDGVIWVGTLNNGCYRIFPQEPGKIEQFDLFLPSGSKSMDIRCFTQDRLGNILIGTFEGVYMVSPVSSKVTFYTSEGIVNGLKHSSIYSLLTDRDGTVWAGSYYGGVDYLTERARGFKKYNYNPYRSDCLGFPFVGDMVEDKRGDLWICLDGGGLTCLNRKTGEFTRYMASEYGLPHNNLKAICYDSKSDLLYIGTHKGGLTCFDIQSGKFNNYDSLKKRRNVAFPRNIIDKVQMWNDSLVVSARNGLFILDGKTGLGRKISGSTFLDFDIDSQGIFWGVNTKSLIRLDLNNKSKFSWINLKSAKSYNLTSVINVGDKVYVSTLGAGIVVFDKIKKESSSLDKEERNILSNYCYNICKTNKGNIVFSTDKGIFLYNPLIDKFYNIEMSALFSENSIVSGCGIYTCRDNELFVGGANGMVSFNENEFFKSSIDLNIYFARLFVNNEKITSGDESGILQESFPMTKSLKLPYNKNNLLVEFATSDVGGNNSDVQYEYYLSGLEKEWTVTKKNEIRYTNLPPGDYCLKVRAKGQMGEDYPILHEASLMIEVENIWYATWWARLLFIVSLLSISIWIYRIKEAKRKVALSLEREQFEKHHIEELNQAKLRFFTNISHEFKTPLTLISTQIEIVLQNSQLSSSARFQLSKVSRYIKQLNELITELLDFRKIDQKKKKLELSEQSLSFFLKEMYYSFIEHAKQHHITYTFDDEIDPSMEMWFDVRQMQKVILNLLSNAFKFTPDNGSIRLKTSLDERIVKVIVEDTGIGISQDDLPYVFDRFYQTVSGGTSSEDKGGTGIGLALAKSIVEQHHGTISVVSRIGEGTLFIVELPIDKSVYEGDEGIEWKDTAVLPERMDTFSDEMLPDDIYMQNDGSNDQAKRILIVEDNVELRQMLYQLFSPLYEVLLASNGVEGLECAKECAPDLILSDVMMPEMSGTEMCHQIKSNMELSHIPVILLTALNSPESNIEGLRMGADDYVTKPFDVRLLLTRCNNMIRNRQLIKEKYTKKMDGEIVMLATNPLDKKFLEDVVKVIDENLDNVDFDIPFMCQEIGMSRTALQRKFKALTNLTPNDFIVQHKLKKAADMLLQEPNLQISEIADKLGFGSAKYFSRLFKELFGSSPAEYRKSAKE